MIYTNISRKRTSQPVAKVVFEVQWKHPHALQSYPESLGHLLRPFGWKQPLDNNTAIVVPMDSKDFLTARWIRGIFTGIMFLSKNRPLIVFIDT